jgi:hypothetical protein
MFSNLNYFNPTAAPKTGKRAKAITKVCPDCGAGIGAAKTRCAPCSDVQAQRKRVAWSKARYAKRRASCSV